MFMIVIMVIGIAAVLITSLSTSALNNKRHERTSEALAQAKQALIGRAVSDPNRPGELPCPDVNDDGISIPGDDYSGSNCKSLIGRLPYKTLGLPDLRDGSGERLWYALSNPFHANGSATLNSDLSGDISISGTLSANNIIAIVFSPGNPISGQSRISTQTASCSTLNDDVVAQSCCATNYLENPNSNQSAANNTINVSYHSDVPTESFND